MFISTDSSHIRSLFWSIIQS